ncbi:MAG: ATP-binding protein [Flavobacteriia bacterium]|nr:MAG: ATP-binding protein [Flavobacteriia bacterium]
MLSISDFESLLGRSESAILDFKERFYDFENDSDKSATSKFVKDIISFSNTIRKETAYIIFGIKELEDGKLELIGINNRYDDAILQDKIKDKVISRPIFSYYTINYSNNLFGIIEFPIWKYEMPIMPSINTLKGLTQGKVYYRNGSSNTEANTIDIIRINDWLRSLESINNISSKHDHISKFLNDLTKAEEKLSVVVSQMLAFAKQYDLKELIEFCEVEISGIKSNTPEKFQYRSQIVHISYNKIEINPYSFINVTAQTLKNEFDRNDEFFDFKIIIHHSLINIENYLEKFSGQTDTSFATMKTDSKTVLDMEKSFDLYVYFFYDNFINLYKNIRQKAIDLLMKV